MEITAISWKSVGNQLKILYTDWPYFYYYAAVFINFSVMLGIMLMCRACVYRNKLALIVIQGKTGVEELTRHYKT